MGIFWQTHTHFGSPAWPNIPVSLLHVFSIAKNICIPDCRVVYYHKEYCEWVTSQTCSGDRTQSPPACLSEVGDDYAASWYYPAACLAYLSPVHTWTLEWPSPFPLHQPTTKTRKMKENGSPVTYNSHLRKAWVCVFSFDNTDSCGLCPPYFTVFRLTAKIHHDELC